jgi:type II secretory pathway pseudopilin PulG
MRAQRGFTYLGLLFAIALLGVGLAAASEAWSATAKRQRLEQLQWVGEQYMRAIGSYYESSPGGAKTYPRSLDDLLLDQRVPFVRRHLRQLYVNPLSEQFDWEVVEAPGKGVRGVRVPASVSVGVPAQRRDFVYAPEALGGTLPR